MFTYTSTVNFTQRESPRRCTYRTRVWVRDDIQIDRHIDRQKDILTHVQTDRQTNRQTARQINLITGRN